MFIADCSGSMAGDSIAQTREALRAILDQMQPADRFNLIAFGSQPHAFFAGLHPANDRVLAQAHTLVAKLDADRGGTEIGAALQLAYQQGSGRLLDILLITDGEVWNTDALVLEARRSGCRIFTVGVGAAVAEDLVRSVAEATNGACERVHPNENMAARIVRHFERIRAPRATATMTWPVEPTRLLLETIEQVFSGDTLHLLAWLPTRPEGLAMLTLMLRDGQSMHQSVALEPWPIAEAADVLPRLAAARRIALLSDEDATTLAVDYQLVTPHTHFLMVDVRAESDKATGLPTLHTVPHRLAAGWGGVGRVTAAAPAALDLEDLDIPAFLRREVESDNAKRVSPSPVSSQAVAKLRRMAGIRTLFGQQEKIASPIPPVAADTPVGLARWLEAHAARLADPAQPLPTLDELAVAHLSDTLLTPLRERVAQGEAEDAVVAALLHAFLNHGPDCGLPRNTRRALRARFRKQVPAHLAAAVEQQVRAWCGADKV